MKQNLCVGSERPVREAARAIVSQLKEKWGTEGPHASTRTQARNSRVWEPERNRTTHRLTDDSQISYLQTFNTVTLSVFDVWFFLIIIVFCLNQKLCLMWCLLTCRSDWHVYQPGWGRFRWTQTHPGPGSKGKAGELKATFNTFHYMTWFLPLKSVGPSCYGNYSMDQIYSGFVEVLLKIPTSCKSGAVTVNGHHKWERNHNSCWNRAARAHLSHTSGVVSILLHISGSIVLFSVYTGHYRR